jgi:uncharacterized protein YdeI (YjbR/CyaY-like superfamily)
MKLFDKMSFTRREEYIQCITCAKKEETKAGRVQKAIEKLKQKG